MLETLSLCLQHFLMFDTILEVLETLPVSETLRSEGKTLPDYLQIDSSKTIPPSQV